MGFKCLVCVVSICGELFSFWLRVVVYLGNAGFWILREGIGLFC